MTFSEVYADEGAALRELADLLKVPKDRQDDFYLEANCVLERVEDTIGYHTAAKMNGPVFRFRRIETAILSARKASTK